MTTNNDLAELMKINKADISKNTLRTYASLLRNLYYTATGAERDEAIDMKWFDNEDKVLEAMKDKPANVRKTTLAALLALVGKDKAAKYKKQMDMDVEQYTDWVKRQEKTETQKKNWKDFSEVVKVVESYEKKAKKIMNGDSILPSEERVLVDWMILALTTGYYFPPRRSMDWFEMSFRNYDRATDNYIDKNQFVFNKYKTAAKYNQQTLDMGSKFRALLTKYIRYIPSDVDMLIFDVHHNPMTAVKLTQRLNTIFQAKISTSMLRHIYLSNRLAAIPKLEELEDLASDMGHSVSQQLEYIKR
jgi:hypothetical protein